MDRTHRHQEILVLRHLDIKVDSMTKMLSWSKMTFTHPLTSGGRQNETRHLRMLAEGEHSHTQRQNQKVITIFWRKC